MMRFEGAFHQSDFEKYKRCPRSFWYSRVLEKEPSLRKIPMVNGTALHKCLELIHKDNLFDAEERKLEYLFRDCWDEAEFDIERDTAFIKWKDREKQLEKLVVRAVVMLTNYCSKDINRNCKVLEAEADFKGKVGRYEIEGRIDQIREYDGKKILVDFKTGITKAPQPRQMRLNYQFGMYAIGMEQTFGYYPDQTGYYRLMDHFPYEKVTWLGKLSYDQHPAWQKWLGTQEMMTVEGYEGMKTSAKIAASKNPDKIQPFVSKKVDRSDLAFTAGQERGPGMYTASFNPNRAKNMEKDVIRMAAAIRRNEFYRNDLSCPSCLYVDTCDEDLDIEIASDRVEAITGF